MTNLRTDAPTILGDLRTNGLFCRLLAGRLVTTAGDSLYDIVAMLQAGAQAGVPDDATDGTPANAVGGDD